MDVFQVSRRRITDLSFFAVAMAAVVGFATYELMDQFIYLVIEPVIYRLTDLNLHNVAFHLTSTDTTRDFNEPDEAYLSTIYLGPILRQAFAALFAIAILAQGYRRVAVRAAIDEEDMAQCPACLSSIPWEATRCAYCGEEQPVEAPPEP